MRLALLIVLALAGCEPTCEDVCEKLVDCENAGTERMSAEECKESCQDQETLYDRWTDTQLRDAFVAEKQCIDASTCDELAAGVCYDEDLWSY